MVKYYTLTSFIITRQGEYGTEARQKGIKKTALVYKQRRLNYFIKTN